MYFGKNEEQDEMLRNVAFHHDLHRFLMDIQTSCSFLCSLFLPSEHLGQLMILEIVRETQPFDQCNVKDKALPSF